jgi:uncharacterized membrane-anchored protein
MKKLSKNNFFIFALAFPIVLLLCMLVKPLSTTYLGETIKLQTVPYDPRDLFYGDYVDLNFEIEEVPLDIVYEPLLKKLDIHGDSSKPYRDVKVFIELKIDKVTGVYKAWRVVETKPKSGVYIKGVMSPYVNKDEGEGYKEVNINIPIERYYLEENTGKQLEKESSQGRLIATVKVYKGYPILQSVEVNK